MAVSGWIKEIDETKTSAEPIKASGLTKKDTYSSKIGKRNLLYKIYEVLKWGYRWPAAVYLWYWPYFYNTC